MTKKLRTEEEKEMVEKMIRIYCRKKEGNHSLCPQCQALLNYAQNIFGEVFDQDAIVTEDRLTGHEFLNSAEVNLYRIPTEEEARELCLLAQEEDAEGYLERAVSAWFEDSDCPADPASDEADLAFDGAAGQNLDQAFFKINLDTSSLPDGVYLLAAAVRSGDKTTWSYFDDAISHFDIEQGVARLTSR